MRIPSSFSQQSKHTCLGSHSPTSVSDLAVHAQSLGLQQLSSLLLWSPSASWCTPPNSVVLPGGVQRGCSAPCLFHLPRKCRSVCQGNAVDWKCTITEVKSHNYYFGYIISLNIASFSAIHTLQNEYMCFCCKDFCHFSLDWCSGDQSNF